MPDSYVVPGQVLVAHLEGEAVLLHMDTKRYYRLNETAACIWKALERRGSIDEIVTALCGEFDVTADVAREEARRVVRDLLDRGLLSQDEATPAS